MAPVLLDVRFQPPQTFFMEPLSGTLPTQAHYDAPPWIPKIPNLQFHNSPDSWMDLPQAVTVPFENSVRIASSIYPQPHRIKSLVSQISATQWDDVSGMSSSVIDLAQPHMELPAIPQVCFLRTFSRRPSHFVNTTATPASAPGANLRT